MFDAADAVKARNSKLIVKLNFKVRVKTVLMAMLPVR
jgi:hypothetical protein